MQDLLASTTVFEGLTPADLETIASHMSLCHFGAGDVICREGEAGDSLFVIREGLEMGRDTFAHVLSEYPAVLLNLNRILSRRLARTNVRQAQTRSRGKAIALVTSGESAAIVPDIVAATRTTSPRSVMALDVDASA